MCGIIGICPRCFDNLPENFAASRLVPGLKFLEYRGYDSVGVATLNGSRVEVRKDAGKIDRVKQELSLEYMNGHVGIGHTRWATHGAPTKLNAHPHLDCTETVAIVQNGIIDNFVHLKDELIKKGHEFKSRTDAEVFAHLIEELIDKGNDFVSAFKSASSQITGPNAIVAISSKNPETVLGYKNESPLVIGVGHDAYFFTSDYYAAYGFVSQNNNGNKGLFVPLSNGEVASISSAGYHIEKLDGTPVLRKPEFVQLNLENVSRGGFPSLTEKEIFEQPQTLKRAFYTQKEYLNKVVGGLRDAKRIIGVAAGTAFYACDDAAYTFHDLTNMEFQAVISSEFKYLPKKISPEKDAIIAVSQSGQTIDTLRPLIDVKSRGFKTYAITNVPTSEVTRHADAYILQHSGPEIAVASTKSLTSQMMILRLLASSLGLEGGKISEKEYQENIQHIYKTPDLVKEVLVTVRDQIKETAVRFSSRESFVFLGRGRNKVVAEEGMLKLQELTYKSVKAYPAGESKHGFIAVVEEGYPVVFVAPYDETRDDLLGNIQEMKARGAHLIVLGYKEDEELKGMLNPKTDVYIGMPLTHPLNSSMVYTVPLQLLANDMALNLKRIDPNRYGDTPDQPRNLAKSVTVP
jgi:glucosamine--fructose-6-phosphate aminotransferase (isomerizing)